MLLSVLSHQEWHVRHSVGTLSSLVYLGDMHLQGIQLTENKFSRTLITLIQISNHILQWSNKTRMILQDRVCRDLSMTEREALEMKTKESYADTSSLMRQTLHSGSIPTGTPIPMMSTIRIDNTTQFQQTISEIIIEIEQLRIKFWNYLNNVCI